MKTLFSILILPLPIFYLSVVITIILYLKKKLIYSRIFLLFSVIWIFVVTTPFIPNILVKNLENRYEVLTASSLNNISKHKNILILGGGHRNDLRFPANDKLSYSALSRLVEGIRIKNLVPGSTLITSGTEKKGDLSQAEVLAQTAVLMGVDSLQIAMQKNPTTTREEASEYKKNHNDSAELVLVTSAIHMPRAMYLFRKAGLQPIAAPTDHLIKRSNHADPWSWVPASTNIYKWESSIHEYVGLFWAKLF